LSHRCNVRLMRSTATGVRSRFAQPLSADIALPPLWQRMRDGEQAHVVAVEKLMAERRTRPTLLLPLWEAAGFVLGAATAVLGKEAAMACTVAVETAIGQHYNDQIRSLLREGYREPQVLAVLKKHRDEELEHLDTGLAHGAEQAPLYTAMSAVIQAGCKAAIEVAKRV